MRSAFAAHLVAAAAFSAAKLHRPSANARAIGVWVSTAIMNFALDHLFSRLAAIGAFNWCCCLLLVHVCCSGCFPNAPVARCISENFRCLARRRTEVYTAHQGGSRPRPMRQSLSRSTLCCGWLLKSGAAYASRLALIKACLYLICKFTCVFSLGRKKARSSAGLNLCRFSSFGRAR